MKKKNRNILLIILLAGAAVIGLGVIAVNRMVDIQMSDIMVRSYADYDSQCPMPLDSITVLERVRFYPESWTVERSLKLLDMDRYATDSVSLYKLDTLTRDRKNRIKERMKEQPEVTPKSPPASPLIKLVGKYCYSRAARKTTVRTMYYDKNGDYIMEVTFTPEDFKEIRRNQQ